MFKHVANGKAFTNIRRTVLCRLKEARPTKGYFKRWVHWLECTRAEKEAMAAQTEDGVTVEEAKAEEGETREEAEAEAEDG